MESRALTPEQFLLTLLVRLAAMAVLATMLARYRRFRHILIFERRGWLDRLVFTLSIGMPIMAGVTSRVILKYDAADLTLEGAFLAGLIAGPYTGALVGLLAAIPPTFAGEVIALPFAVGCGFAGGGLREACPKEAIWKFSPFMLMDLPKHLWHMIRKIEPNWQIILLLAPVALELLRLTLGARFGEGRLFFFNSPSPWMMTVVVLSTAIGVATPIKIWNSARIEHRLQEQEKLLMAARVEALASQINPHFLFNTLTSILSLIRSQPETARLLIMKLSGLLRRLLSSQDHFVTLREELEAIDEYLDIEQMRFGAKLKIEKQIDPDTLDVVVPSMLLQPIVENSIKHGLEPKVGHGRIIIKSIRQDGHAIIDVIDNGVGVSSQDANRVKGTGIGLRNVNERLQVIYGANYQLQLDSVPGEGTCARVVIPELVVPSRITA